MSPRRNKAFSVVGLSSSFPYFLKLVSFDFEFRIFGDVFIPKKKGVTSLHTVKWAKEIRQTNKTGTGNRCSPFFFDKHKTRAQLTPPTPLTSAVGEAGAQLSLLVEVVAAVLPSPLLVAVVVPPCLVLVEPVVVVLPFLLQVGQVVVVLPCLLAAAGAQPSLRVVVVVLPSLLLVGQVVAVRPCLVSEVRVVVLPCLRAVAVVPPCLVLVEPVVAVLLFLLQVGQVVAVLPCLLAVVVVPPCRLLAEPVVVVLPFLLQVGQVVAVMLPSVLALVAGQPSWVSVVRAAQAASCCLATELAVVVLPPCLPLVVAVAHPLLA